MRLLLRYTLVILALGSLQTAFAQATLTVTATANSSAYGYVMNNSYTFVFSLTGNFGAIGGDFNGDPLRWRTYNDPDVSTNPTGYFWTGISGTGLTGSYTLPSNMAWDDLMLNASSEILSNEIRLTAWSTTGTETTGLTAVDGSTAIGGLRLSYTNVSGLPGDGNFHYLSAYQEPTAYLAGYNGTYSTNGTFLLYDTSLGTLAQFTATSLTISAVPEPSTYVMLAGLGVLGYTLIRRRYVKQPAA